MSKQYTCINCNRTGDKNFDIIPMPNGRPIIVCNARTACLKRQRDREKNES